MRIYTHGWAGVGFGLQRIFFDRDVRDRLEINDGIPAASSSGTLWGMFDPEAGKEHLDLPYCGGGSLAYQRRHEEVLAPLLTPYGELIDCETELGDYRIFRCLNVVDAFAGHVKKISRPDGIGLVNEYSFDCSKLAADSVFTVPHQRNPGFVYYGGSFVEALDRLELTYAPFKLLFDESTGFAQEAYL